MINGKSRFVNSIAKNPKTVKTRMHFHPNNALAVVGRAANGEYAGYAGGGVVTENIKEKFHV